MNRSEADRQRLLEEAHEIRARHAEIAGDLSREEERHFLERRYKDLFQQLRSNKDSLEMPSYWQPPTGDVVVVEPSRFRTVFLPLLLGFSSAFCTCWIYFSVAPLNFSRISTKELNLLDSWGDVRASLRHENSNSNLFFFDPHGAVRVKLGFGPAGDGLWLYGPDEKIRSFVGTEKNGESVFLAYDKEGKLIHRATYMKTKAATP